MNLYRAAEEARAKANEHKASLELYLSEIKNAGRNVTIEDAEKMQGIKVNLLTELNRHTEIYRQIYGGK